MFLKVRLKELQQSINEEDDLNWTEILRALCVCAAPGHATSTRRSADVY